MEFACKLAGTKIIVVLGHTSCGAVKGACDNASLGNLTSMLGKIRPAVNAVNEPAEKSQRNSGNIDFVNNVARKNVQMSIQRIKDLLKVSGQPPCTEYFDYYWDEAPLIDHENEGNFLPHSDPNFSKRTLDSQTLVRNSRPVTSVDVLSEDYLYLIMFYSVVGLYILCKLLK